jgi:DNA-binding transcriptional LysR family regulator
MDLLALADFNLVARHGGFGKAARATGRPKATLSRRVTELEAVLGLRLFERGARNLKLTDEGRALHQRTSVLLTELDETAAAIASGAEKPRGRLRISAPLLLSQTAMGKIGAGFALKYPEVRLEITTEDRAVDMIEEGYDLVIRVNPDPDESRGKSQPSPPCCRYFRAGRRAWYRRSTNLECHDRERRRYDQHRASPCAVVAHHGPGCRANRRGCCTLANIAGEP